VGRVTKGTVIVATCLALSGASVSVFPITELTPTTLIGYVKPIPVGAQCSVTETFAGGAAGGVPAVVGTVTVPAADAPAVDVSARDEFPGGSVQATKRVTGGEALLPTVEFTVQVSCSRNLLAGGAETIVNQTVTLRGGQTVEVANGLPLGTRCWAEETTTGATSVSVDFDSQTNAAEIRGSGEVVLLSATNDNDVADVTVSCGSVREGSRIWWHVDGVGQEHIEVDDVERALVGRRQHHRGRRTIEVGAQPVAGRDAPSVTGVQTREAESGIGGHQIVADRHLVVEELSGHHGTDRVVSDVLW